MLAFSPLKPTTKEGDAVDITCFSFSDFLEFAAPAGFLLDITDFDDLIHEGVVLSELGMDFMEEFSVSGVGGDPYSDDRDTGNQVAPICYEKTVISEGDECKNSVPHTSKDDEIESEKWKKILSSEKANKSNNNNSKNTGHGKRKTKKVVFVALEQIQSYEDLWKTGAEKAAIAATTATIAVMH